MLNEKLIAIQSALKAPKGQYNKFGGFHYRSAEDILEAVKPLLKEQGVSLTISDEIFAVGNRIYVKATATISDGKEKISTTANAREDDSKKGMDGSQISGSASSYARKYALNGLFCIDDTKDADTDEQHNIVSRAQQQNAQQQNRAQQAQQNAQAYESILAAVISEIQGAMNIEHLTQIYNTNQAFHADSRFVTALSARKNEIKG